LSIAEFVQKSNISFIAKNLEVIEEEFRSQNLGVRIKTLDDSLTLRYPLFRSELILNFDPDS